MNFFKKINSYINSYNYISKIRKYIIRYLSNIQDNNKT